MEEEIKIRKAIKLLEDNGYIIKHLTSGQVLDSKLCDEYASRGEDMNCTECRCSCCIMH